MHKLQFVDLLGTKLVAPLGRQRRITAQRLPLGEAVKNL